MLEQLFTEKRRELDQQLTMLGVPKHAEFPFCHRCFSTAPVEPALLASALEILEHAPAVGTSGDAIGADANCKAARALVAQYREIDPAFTGRIEVRQDIPAGLMVSGRTLMVSQSTRMPRHRLDALLQHEVSVHLLTCVQRRCAGPQDLPHRPRRI